CRGQRLGPQAWKDPRRPRGYCRVGGHHRDGLAVHRVRRQDRPRPRDDLGAEDSDRAVLVHRRHDSVACSRGPGNCRDPRARKSEMTPLVIGALGLVALFVLILLRVPIGFAMIIVGVVGYALQAGWAPAATIL